MCIEFDSLRRQSFSHAMAKLLSMTGLRSLWAVDLQRTPTVRAMAHAGKLDALLVALRSARFLAGKAGFADAAKALAGKLDEVAKLAAELAASVVVPAVDDVMVLDADWGKRGRGARILTWIAQTGAAAPAVAQRFQLAISTATKYVRQARKQAMATTTAQKAADTNRRTANRQLAA